MSFDTISNLHNNMSMQINTNTQTQSALGDFKGMEVKVNTEDPNSALADSCEELTFAKDNDKETKLSDRKQKQSKELNYLERFHKVCHKEDIYQFDKNLDKLRLFLNNKQPNNHQIDDFLQDLVDSSKNSYAFAYAFLMDAQDNHDDLTISDEQRKLIKQASERLYSQNKIQIEAQCNALEVLDDTSYASAFDLSNMYSEIATGQQDEVTLVTFLANKCGENNLKDGVDHMFKALANDLSSAYRSNDCDILNNIASTLTRATSINSGLKITADFLSYVKDKLNLQSNDITNSSLLINILNTSKQNFVSPNSMHALYQTHISVQNPEEDVLLGQAFFKMIKETSPYMYLHTDDRNKLVDATQQLVDSLIDAEDEWLENQQM